MKVVSTLASMFQVALAVLATLIALACALCTLERWIEQRKPHELIWAIAFALFAVASAALAIGARSGWTEPLFRVFYLFGAILNVPFLALGTIYLLAGEKAGQRALIAVAFFCAFATGTLVATPFTSPLPADRLAQGSEVFGALPRVLAAVASGGGALVILTGALRSAIRARGRRLAANSLIAAGTVVTGASGLLNSAMGEMNAFSVTLAAGIALLFAGYLLATSSSPPSVLEREPPTWAPSTR